MLHDANLKNALQKAEKKILQLHTALQNLKTGFVIIETNRKIIFVNEAFANSFGYTQEKLVGGRITDVISRVSFRRVKKWLRAKKITSLSHTVQCITNEGDKVSAEIKGFLVVDLNGITTGAVITLEKILKDKYTIADVAKVVGYDKTSLIRFEKKGLIPKAQRDKYGWRYYSQKDFNDIVRKIRLLKADHVMEKGL